MNLQIRNVPSELHRELKARAARRGISLSAYLIEQLTELAARPTYEEWLARTHRSRPRVTGVNAADAVRAERDSR